MNDIEKEINWRRKTMDTTIEKKFTATRNPCKLCSPLGASIVFRGIKILFPSFTEVRAVLLISAVI